MPTWTNAREPTALYKKLNPRWNKWNELSQILKAYYGSALYQQIQQPSFMGKLTCITV